MRRRISTSTQLRTVHGKNVPGPARAGVGRGDGGPATSLECADASDCGRAAGGDPAPRASHERRHQFRAGGRRAATRADTGRPAARIWRRSASSPGLLRGAMAPSVSATLTPAQAQITADPPMRAYFILPNGLYRYEPAGHTLQPISDNDFRAAGGRCDAKGAHRAGGRLPDHRRRRHARFLRPLRDPGKDRHGTASGESLAEHPTPGGGPGPVGREYRRGGRARPGVPSRGSPAVTSRCMQPSSVTRRPGQTPITAVQPAETTQTSGRVLFVVAPMGFQG